MKSPEAFKAFYDSSLLPVLQLIEADRKKIVSAILLYVLGAIAIAVPVFIFLGGPWFVIPLIIAGLMFFFKYRDQIKMHEMRFKNEVIAKMITFIDPGLKYEPTNYIGEQDYRRSKLFLGDFNVYRGDDLIHGKLDKTAICFSELHTELETTTRDSDGNKKKSRTTVFRGIFFTADFNKQFKGETFVLPDVAESMLGGLGKMFQKLDYKRPQLITLEDREFEKAFCVYGTDQIEARYILSTALMQRILEFKNQTQRRISVSFINSQIFIGIPISDNLFEAPIFNSVLNYKRIAEFQRYLDLCIGTVETLDLNTRIWTKE